MRGSALSAMLVFATACPAAEVDFYRDVYPFLKVNCVSCHNKTTTKADLNMETPELMIKGGDSGPAIVPGQSMESLIVAASLHTRDMEMPPPNNKSGAVNLTTAEVALLKLWIDQGAKDSVRGERAVAWQPLAPGVHPIYSVAMSGDGRYAACGRSNEIFVYDLATRQLVGRVGDPAEKGGAAHRAMVQSLAFSADGSRLASGSFREVKIWRALAGREQPGQAGTVAAAPPVSEATLKMIAEKGKVVVVSHAGAPDGKLVVTGCGDGSVRVWDSATAAPLAVLRGSLAGRRKIEALEWTVAAQGLEQAFHKAEITRIEAQEKSLDELLKKAKEAILAMDKVLPEKRKAVQPALEAAAAAQKAVDEMGAQLEAAPAGKADPALGKQLKDAQEKLIAAKMAETSALAAVSAAESNVKDAEEDVKRITAAKAANAKSVAQAIAAISTAKATADKATADVTAVRESLSKGAAQPVAVAFSGDAQRVAAFLDDGVMRVWAVATGVAIDEVSADAVATVAVTANADGSFTAARSVTLTTGSPPRWELERTLGGEENLALFADRVNAVRFSPDGKTLAAGSGELSRTGDIFLIDVASGKVRQAWKELHADAVLCLDFSPDGKLLASGGADKTAKVTEIASGKQVGLFEGHTHHVTGIGFRADGRVVATAGADGVVITWDMILGERRKKIEGWTKEVTSLQFIGATNQIVTSAGDNRIRVVTDEGAEVRSMANLPDYMQATASSPTGATIIAGGEDSYLRVWDGANGKELVAFGGGK